MNDDEKVIYFGETDARNKRIKFGIKKADRSRHMYAIGKTGMGKSTLLESLAIQDIQNGDGIAFIDPHGKSADLLLEYVPKERIKDVVYFAPFDMEYPVSFNVMEDVGAERRYLVASGLMAAFKKIWVDAWSARMEYILGNIMLALLEYPGSTLIGVNRMLTDKDFRKEVVNNISDPSVRSFWVNEYASYTDKFAAEAAPAIQNKVGQFVANPLIRNIIGQPKSTFDIRQVMDEKKILIINLSKGRVGEANANLLGSMLITKIYLAAMSRADLNERGLKAAPNFYMYVDEFQSFANESFADILSEARKYKLNLIIAHQYIEQMTEEVRAAVFGNVGTMCVFRVGATDAEYLEKEFAPAFTAEDLVNLQKYQMYLKLMIDGVTSPPFSAAGMSPIPRPEIMYVKEIIDASRAQHARPRAEVEDEIRLWHEIQFGRGGGSGGGASSSGGQGGGQGASRAPSGSTGGSSQAGSRSTGDRPSSSSGASRPDRPIDRSAAPQGANLGAQRPQNMSRAPIAGSNMARQGEQQRGDAQRFDRPARPAPSSPNAAQAAGQSAVQTTQTSSQTSQPQAPVGSGNAATSQAPGVQRFGSQSQRPVIAPASEAQSPENSAEKSHQAEVRENELRKAISLSYLKEPEEPETKKDDKSPKPENIAALREALLSVMQSANTADIAPSKKEPQNRDDERQEAIQDMARQPRKEERELNSNRPERMQPHNKPQASPEHRHNPSFSVHSKKETFHTVSDRVDRNMHAQKTDHKEPHAHTHTGSQAHGHTQANAATGTGAENVTKPAHKKNEVSSDLLEDLFNGK